MNGDSPLSNLICLRSPSPQSPLPVRLDLQVQDHVYSRSSDQCSRFFTTLTQDLDPVDSIFFRGFELMNGKEVLWMIRQRAETTERETQGSLSLSLTSDKLPNGDHVTCLSPIPPYSSSSIRATAVELTMQVIVIAMCTREKVVHPNPKISKRII